MGVVAEVWYAPDAKFVVRGEEVVTEVVDYQKTVDAVDVTEPKRRPAAVSLHVGSTLGEPQRLACLERAAAPRTRPG